MGVPTRSRNAHRMKAGGSPTRRGVTGSGSGPASGPSPRSMSSSVCSTSTQPIRIPRTTAPLGPGRTCSPTRRLPWTWRPARSSGTTRRSITTSGTGTTSPAPVLFDVTRNGETIKGVGAAGKNCLLYLWHRETGEPINPMVETNVPTETNVPGEVVYPTQPIPYNARGVPLTPFCATYLDLEDPVLQAQARQMYTPYSTDEHYIVAHGGSSFGSPAFSPRDRSALHHRQERRRLAPRQASRRQSEIGGRRRSREELHRDQSHPGLPACDDADGLRAG